MFQLIKKNLSDLEYEEVLRLQQDCLRIFGHLTDVKFLLSKRLSKKHSADDDEKIRKVLQLIVHEFKGYSAEAKKVLLDELSIR